MIGNTVIHNFRVCEMGRGYFISCSSKLAAQMSLSINIAQMNSRIEVNSTWIGDMANGPMSDDEAIASTRKNYQQIKCSWGVAAFVHEEVSSPGTLAEIVWAVAHGIPTLVFVFDQDAPEEVSLLENRVVFKEGPWMMLNGLNSSKMKFAKIGIGGCATTLMQLDSLFLEAFGLNAKSEPGAADCATTKPPTQQPADEKLVPVTIDLSLADAKMTFSLFFCWLELVRASSECPETMQDVVRVSQVFRAAIERAESVAESEEVDG